MPDPKPVAEEISGIDVLELEDMVKLLWSHGIYAESGMGCTGPVIRVSEEDLEEAMKHFAGGNAIRKLFLKDTYLIGRRCSTETWKKVSD